jgi:hypothetical protein
VRLSATQEGHLCSAGFALFFICVVFDVFEQTDLNGARGGGGFV